MDNREKILQNILDMESGGVSLPTMEKTQGMPGDILQNFRDMVAAAGGKIIELTSVEDIESSVYASLPPFEKIISTIPETRWHSPWVTTDPHDFADVELAVLRGHFGVAENGAVWVTDQIMGDRAIPFIVQHLALVIGKADIVSTMTDAYEKISSSVYDFGVFIAGPSKTADIEQSLVFGAHGPKSLIVFLIG